MDQLYFEKLMEAMRILIVPSSTGTAKELSDTFKNNIAEFENFISKNEIKIENIRSGIFNKTFDPALTDDSDIGWIFTSHCLRILTSLSASLRLTSTDFVGFSVNQQRAILSCLQFVIGLGVSPNLLPGIGVPIDKRLSFSLFLKVLDGNSNHWIQYERLAVCTEQLIFLSEDEHLGSIIISTYLTDIVAALCQLSFSPLKKPKLDAANSSEDMTVEKFEKLMNERILFVEKLDSLLERTYKPVLIQTLLDLQSFSTDGKVKTPKWMKAACGKLLTRILLMPSGISSFIQSFVGNEFDGNSSNSKAPVWKKCELAAKLISALPSGYSNEEYLSTISQQIIDLCGSLSDASTPKSVVLSDLINNFLVSFPNATKDHIFNPLLRNLRLLTETGFQNESEEVLCAEKFSSSILTLQCLCIRTGDLHPYLIDVLNESFPVLLAAYSFSLQVSSILKKPLALIITKFLMNIDQDEGILILTSAICKSAKALEYLNFSLNSDLNICVTSRLIADSEWIETDQNLAEGLCSVLAELPEEPLTAQFFIHLLKNLTSILNEDSNETNEPSEKLLLNMEKLEGKRIEQLRKNLVLMNLISGLSEKIGSSLLKQKSQIINFIVNTLERGAELCNGDRENVQMMESETLTMAMGVLTTVMSDDQKMSNKEMLDVLQCLPSLKSIASKHPDECVKMMAHELQKALATELSGAAHKNTKAKEKGVADSRKLEDAFNSRSENLSNFEKAWNDLSDPLLPVRGHGLLAIAKLISSKDPETIKNKHRILAIFQENLSNEDSYIYLASIQGLAALSDIYPEDVILHLTDEFVKLTSKDSDVEVKLKVGEILVKVTKNLGNMVPMYRDMFLNAFLTGLKDTDAHIRASCLSNIGEVCKGLCFSIGPYLQELLHCLQCAISPTEQPEVRRAAVLVITLIFQGCGVHTLQVLDKEMKEIYRTLKFIYQTDKDDVVKLHAQIALEELNTIMKSLVFPEQTLVKKISILDGL